MLKFIARMFMYLSLYWFDVIILLGKKLPNFKIMLQVYKQVTKFGVYLRSYKFCCFVKLSKQIQLTTVTEDMVPVAVESQVQFGFLDALEGDRQDVALPVGVYGQNLGQHLWIRLQALFL